MGAGLQVTYEAVHCVHRPHHYVRDFRSLTSPSTSGLLLLVQTSIMMYRYQVPGIEFKDPRRGPVRPRTPVPLDSPRGPSESLTSMFLVIDRY